VGRHLAFHLSRDEAAAKMGHAALLAVEAESEEEKSAGG